jgi:hypothetical protein
MDKDKALKLALEALEKSLPRLAPYGEQDWLDSKAAITAIKQARSAPVQRQWVGLTDEERTEIRREHYARTLPLMEAIEAKLKEKNT